MGGDIRMSQNPGISGLGEFTSAEVAFIQTLVGLNYAQGDILYVDSTLQLKNLGAGTSGYFLKTQGAGANPVWASTSSGSLTIGTTTITSGTTTRILYDNSGVLGEYTISGSGTVVAMATSPSFTTPTIGVASATSINKMAITAPATSSTLAVADGKTLTSSNTLTLAGTDGTTMTFPGTSATIARTDAANTFTGTQTITTLAGTTSITGAASNMTVTSGTGNSRTMILQTTTSGGTATTALTLGADQSATFAGHLVVEGVTSTGATGTGKFVFDGSPTLTTPTIGAATATTVNKVTITAPASGSTLTITDGKTLIVNQTMTLTSSGTSSVITLPNSTDTVGGLATAQTWTGQNKFNNAINVNNAIAASSSAATVPITYALNTVTNDAAGTLTITMTTTSAVDGQMTIVRILDHSAATQTISWVNTENSNVTAPTTSNGSTTLFLTVGFIYNGGSGKWRCIASA